MTASHWWTLADTVWCHAAAVSGFDVFSKWVDLISKIATVFGGLWAIFWAIRTWRESTQQRRDELRWKQAEQGKKIWDEIIADARCVDALQMIEHSGHKYYVPLGDGSNLILMVTADVLTSALTHPESEAADDLFIHDRFDQLFYFFDRLEHHIVSNLIRFEDIQSPTEYYVEQMVPQRESYIHYLKHLRYRGILDLLDRFAVWRRARHAA